MNRSAPPRKGNGALAGSGTQNKLLYNTGKISLQIGLGKENGSLSHRRTRQRSNRYRIRRVLRESLPYNPSVAFS